MKQNSKTRKCILNGLIILACNIFFNIMGALIFLSDYAIAVKVIADIVVFAMILVVSFFKGGSTAETDYKFIEKQLPMSEKNEFRAVNVNIFKSLYNLISYAAPLIIIILIGALINKGVFGLISYALLSPVVWVTMGQAQEMSMLTGFFIYLVFILAVCGMFFFNYVRKINKQKKVRREIASELRSFNN